MKGGGILEEIAFAPEDGSKEGKAKEDISQ